MLLIGFSKTKVIPLMIRTYFYTNISGENDFLSYEQI